jgi:hypothetical protein
MVPLGKEEMEEVQKSKGQLVEEVDIMEAQEEVDCQEVLDLVEEVHPSSQDIRERWLSCLLVIPLNRERREKLLMGLEIVRRH